MSFLILTTTRYLDAKNDVQYLPHFIEAPCRAYMIAKCNPTGRHSPEVFILSLGVQVSTYKVQIWNPNLGIIPLFMHKDPPRVLEKVVHSPFCMVAG